MALDQSFAGKVYPATAPYEISREKIREFADAIGDPAPEFRDRQAAADLGYPDVIAPPTFAIIVTTPAGSQIRTDPQLGVDYDRVVHGEQRFVHARPLRAGDVVQVVSTIESIRVAAGNDLLATRSDVSTVDGEHVLSAYSLIVVRGEQAES
jgi:acyl dehydratase